MATIISEAEVTAAIEEALAEDFGDMEDSNADETPTETKIETMRFSFEPRNKYVTEVKDMNEYVLSYFESMNHMSKRIITEQRELMAEHGSRWNQLSLEEQDKLIDNRMLDPKVRKHYYVDGTFSTRKPDWFPVLRLAHGVSGSENSFNPRDSIASVTEMHSKDQFSSPWSWETKSQQDLSLLEEGELEQHLKNALEADAEEISTLASAEFKRRALNDVDTRSKDTSQSGSFPGSEPLSRKEFMFDGVKHSPASSMQGSKGSLSSSSSLPKGSKASLVSTTPPKGSKSNLVSTITPKGSNSNLASSTPLKGSKKNLVSDTPLTGSAVKVNVSSETQLWESSASFSTQLASEPSSQREDIGLQELNKSSTVSSEFNVDTASNSNDLMAFLQNW
ncbi:unnamed protein product [Porites evermanni]|uniref:DUF4706 domain-containing protein n=1 Tax=Porites evermanni TaxID=104178 RepID=A0ABN8R0Y0_9CNID|nr:unnamed protein product [Porites evermanni]